MKPPVLQQKASRMPQEDSISCVARMCRVAAEDTSYAAADDLLPQMRHRLSQPKAGLVLQEKTFSFWGEQAFIWDDLYPCVYSPLLVFY